MKKLNFLLLLGVLILGMSFQGCENPALEEAVSAAQQEELALENGGEESRGTVTYIKDIRIEISDSYRPQKEVTEFVDEGYTRLMPEAYDNYKPYMDYAQDANGDLNQGAGGKWIFVWYKTTTEINKSITNLYLYSGYSSNHTPKSGDYYNYKHVPMSDNNTSNKGSDLNAGIPYRKIIYLLGTKEAGVPITNIKLIVSNKKYNSLPAGYFHVKNQDGDFPQDLNEGVGGKYIYLLYKPVANIDNRDKLHNANSNCITTTISSQKGTNGYDYANYNFVNDPVFTAAKWANYTDGRMPYEKRGLIKFPDLSRIPSGAYIKEAKLYLYGENHNPCRMSNDAYLQRITSNWDPETVTWNTKPYSTSSQQIEIPRLENNERYCANVINLVRGWVSGKYSNYGLMLRLQFQQEELDPYKRFATMQFKSWNSSDYHDWPQLKITYYY